jgi:hypothetical protein
MKAPFRTQKLISYLPTITLLATAILLLPLLGNATPAAAPLAQMDCPSGCTKPGGTVRVGSATGVQIDSEVTVPVYLENVTDLYGAEIVLSFDPSILQVQDDKPGTVGTQITPGNLPDPEQCFVVQNAANNEAGTIAYAVSLLRPSPPATGDGVLARIRFKAIGTGTSPIRVSRAILVASDACCLEITTEDGSVSTGTANVGAVQGVVRVEGRTNYGGVTVSIGGKEATTATDGSFTVNGIAPGDYTLSAVIDSYLRADRPNVTISAGNTTSVPAVTLLAGDIDNNCQIDIFDLVALGSAYGTSPPDEPAADFNQDNQLNIFDLVLLAGNYGLTCPTDW